MRSRIGVLILSALLLTSGCLGIGEGVEPPTVLGCMDEEAVNFDSNANEDDGSCEFEQPPPPPPAAGLPEEIPAHFAEWMAAPVNGTTYHFDVNEPCANDSNDGLSGTCDGSGGGPWVTFFGMAGIGMMPGDELLFHEGAYDIPMQMNSDGVENTGHGLTFNQSGTPAEPIRIRAADGEVVWWDANIDPSTYSSSTTYLYDWKGVDAFLIRGNYNIFEGINIRGCGNPTCIQWSGYHIIWTNSTISGGAEDGIKTTALASDGLMWNLTFRDFSDNAVDAYGIDGLWIVQSEFTDNDPRWNSNGDNGTPFWTKGGAENVWLIENYFHDMIVKQYAMMLGGCCWENWVDAYTNQIPNPVAIGVYALRNTLQNISHGASGNEKWFGAMGVEGAHDVEIHNNIFLDVEAVFGVKATIRNPDRVEADNISFTENIVVGGVSRGLHHIAHFPTDLIIDSNTYYVDEDLASSHNNTSYETLAEWQTALDWDLNSIQLPEDQYHNGTVLE